MKNPHLIPPQVVVTNSLDRLSAALEENSIVVSRNTEELVSLNDNLHDTQAKVGELLKKVSGMGFLAKMFGS